MLKAVKKGLTIRVTESLHRVAYGVSEENAC
jgi:hypothetical protein